MGQLGDTLKERRVSLGITIEQAEEQTKIRGRLLQALEEGDYARLPNPGYVRGYVSSYARYLELDPVPLLAMYRAETGSGRFHDVNLPTDTAVAPRGEQHAVPIRTALIVVAVVVVISAGIWVAWRLTRTPDQIPPIPTTGETSATAPGTQQQAATPFALKVTVDANGASSLVVVIDGQQAYSGTLTGGQSKEFQVPNTAEITVGKPSAVTVTRDGKPVTLPNKSPATITLTATPVQP